MSVKFEDQVPEDLFAELQRSIELNGLFWTEGESSDVVHALVVSLDGVRQASPAPWLKTLDLTASRHDGCSHTFGCGIRLFLLQIRWQDEENLVISQSSPSFQPRAWLKTQSDPQASSIWAG